VVIFTLLNVTLCPFVTKSGSNFLVWAEIVFLTGQEIFVPEWTMEEFVSFNWRHSVGQNHFYVMMHLNKDSAIQISCSRFCTLYKSVKLDPLQPSGRLDIPSGRPEFSVRTLRTFRPDLPLCQEASNCSNLNPSGRFSSTSRSHSCSISYGISFENIDMGRQLQPSGRCGFPSRRTHP
jgi:hypothetical protein